MSKPQHKSLTMFYTEGNPVAALVSKFGRRRARSTMTFQTAEAALAWCRLNHSAFVYFPSANYSLN